MRTYVGTGLFQPYCPRILGPLTRVQFCLLLDSPQTGSHLWPPHRLDSLAVSHFIKTSEHQGFWNFLYGSSPSPRDQAAETAQLGSFRDAPASPAVPGRASHSKVLHLGGRQPDVPGAGTQCRGIEPAPDKPRTGVPPGDGLGQALL